jgi:uncharacterized surface protein with fasciclin (FAS1) repeats
MRQSTLKRKSTTAIVTVLLGLTVSGCGLFGEDETIDVAAAQEQFCADLEEYLGSLGDYGGLFEDVEVTVGDVRTASEELAPGREAVLESAATFQEAVEAEATPGVVVDIVEPESIEAVEAAEAAFADATDVEDRTPVAEAGVAFTSAAYQLEVAWVRLFADAGCIEDEAQATEWVADYVKALQTDLRDAGFYTGAIDGIYGPATIDAVETLQREAGLPVTGLVDPATQTVLATLLGQQESAQVAALQGILTSTGHYSGPIDGQWSQEVEDALKALQTDLGVPATGVVDAATLRAFEAALEEAGQPPVTTPTEPGATTTAPAPPTTVDAGPGTTTTTVAPTTTAAAPPTTAPPVSGGILDALADAGQFGQLLAAIEAAGLTETLSGPGPFTLFAPTDEAFSQLAEPLPSDPEDLAAILLYHTVEDNLSGFALAGVSSVTTAQGSDVAVAVDQGQIVLNGAALVTVTNVPGSNGVAHVVNAVLIPPG